MVYNCSGDRGPRLKTTGLVILWNWLLKFYNSWILGNADKKDTHLTRPFRYLAIQIHEQHIFLRWRRKHRLEENRHRDKRVWSDCIGAFLNKADQPLNKLRRRRVYSQRRFASLARSHHTPPVRCDDQAGVRLLSTVLMLRPDTAWTKVTKVNNTKRNDLSIHHCSQDTAKETSPTTITTTQTTRLNAFELSSQLEAKYLTTGIILLIHEVCRRRSVKNQAEQRSALMQSLIKKRRKSRYTALFSLCSVTSGPRAPIFACSVRKATQLLSQWMLHWWQGNGSTERESFLASTH